MTVTEDIFQFILYKVFTSHKYIIKKIEAISKIIKYK